MIDQLSILNYFTHKPKLNNRELEVYTALLELGEATSWTILTHLKLRNVNYVRPRLTDLKKRELVEKVRQVERVDENGLPIKEWTWRVCEHG